MTQSSEEKSMFELRKNLWIRLAILAALVTLAGEGPGRAHEGAEEGGATEAAGTIAGFGGHGYRLAVEAVASLMAG